MFLTEGGTKLRRTLEAVFSHLFLLLMLVVLLPGVGFSVAYFLPRSYQSTASLWALQRYEVISATGVESDLTATPASTQATALSELLLSRTFALAVANATNLPSTLDASIRTDPQLRDDTLVTEMTKVQVVSQGYSLFTISYQNQEPQVAQQVVQEVIQKFGAQSQILTVAEGKQLLDNYNVELTQTQQEASAAAAAEQQYLLAHQSLETLIVRSGQQSAIAEDPQYALLNQQTQQAQATVQTIQNDIATVKQEMGTQGGTASSLFKVLDSPNFPVRPVSRLKTLLLAVGVGLGGAMLAIVLYIVILVRRDRTVYTAADLQKVAPISVVMQFPLLPSVSVPLLLGQSGHRRT